MYFLCTKGMRGFRGVGPPELARCASYEATFMLNWSTVGGNWSNKVKIYGQNLKLKLKK